MKVNKMWKSSKLIQLINDHFRKTFLNGDVMLTSGIRALPKAEIKEILLKVAQFNDFTPENDPYGEHDLGSFDYHGKTIMWKIDYYDKNYEYASENPADVRITNRVLTIMLAEEY